MSNPVHAIYLFCPININTDGWICDLLYLETKSINLFVTVFAPISARCCPCTNSQAPYYVTLHSLTNSLTKSSADALPNLVKAVAEDAVRYRPAYHYKFNLEIPA